MDLRDFITELERSKELERVEGADWDVEIGVVTELCDEKWGPALLFDKIKGYPPGYRVTSNLIATPRRVAAALGFPPDISNIELVRLVKDKFKDLKAIPPTPVSEGPLLENVFEGKDVDLFKFPVPRWHEHDGGRYIGTADMVIMRDPMEDGSMLVPIGFRHMIGYTGDIHLPREAGQDHCGELLGAREVVPCSCCIRGSPSAMDTRFHWSSVGS